MDFDNQKKQALNKKDHSKKASWDKKITELCNEINKKHNYYTTSSCSGRILLLKQAKQKNLSGWLIVTHETAKPEEFQKALEQYKGRQALFFRQESAILHIAARTIQDANKFVTLARNNGFKRSGIITTKNKIIIECICPESINTTVFDKQPLITKEYLEYLINLANKKLEKSWKAISKFKKSIIQL